MSREKKGKQSTGVEEKKVFSTEDMSFYVNCTIKMAGKLTVTEIKAHCWAMSIMPRKNIEHCSECDSPYKACCPCVLKNTITSDAIAKDGDCCPWHHEHGRDADKPINKHEKISSYAPEPEEEVEPEKDRGNGDKTAKKLLAAIEKVPTILDIIKESREEDIPFDKIKPVIIECGQEVMLDVDKVFPDPDQPRKRKRDIEELAFSIKLKGQSTAIEVEDMGNETYKLIKGERRWLAHQYAGLKKIRAIIRKVDGPKDRYLTAAVDNTGWNDYDHLEALEMIQKIMNDFGFNKLQTARHLAKPYFWVIQHAKLANLHPEILEYLNPDLNDGEPKLQFLLAVDLAKIKDKKVQLAIAKKIVAEGMKTIVAKFFITSELHKRGMTVLRGERGRAPSDDYAILQNFIKTTHEKLDGFLSLGKNHMNHVFRCRSVEEREMIKRSLKSTIAKIEKMIDSI